MCSLFGFVNSPLGLSHGCRSRLHTHSLPIPVVEKETFLPPETLAKFSHWLQSPDKGGERLASLRQSRCILRAGPVPTPSRPGRLKVEERESTWEKAESYWSKRGMWGATCVMERWTISIVYSSEVGSFLGYWGLGLWEGVAGFRPHALPRGLPKPGPPGTCDPVSEAVAVCLCSRKGQDSFLCYKVVTLETQSNY